MSKDRVGGTEKNEIGEERGERGEAMTATFLFSLLRFFLLLFSPQRGRFFFFLEKRRPLEGPSAPARTLSFFFFFLSTFFSCSPQNKKNP